MKVYVLSKKFNDKSKSWQEPIAVVLGSTGTLLRDLMEEFVIITSQEQKEAMTALNEISHLSKDAFNELAAYQPAIDNLNKIADPETAPVKPGDRVFVAYTEGADKDPPVIRSVATWKNEKTSMHVKDVPVFKDMEEYRVYERKQAAWTEIGDLSENTRKLLGLKI